MSGSYFTEDQKIMQPTVRTPNFWDMDAVADIEDTFYQKGYRFVHCRLRADSNGVLHNTWCVPRDQLFIFVEACFQKRVMVQVEAVGKYEANIIFVCDNSYSQIKEVIRRVPKCVGDDL